MASKTRIEDTRGKIDFSQSEEPTLNSEETKTGWFFIDWLVKGINFLWFKLKDLFPLTQATTHNYLPKIDNLNKKLVKSNISDDGSTVKIDSPLDLNKNSINNGGFEVVSSLPTTNNFDGRQVTYQGRSYIWNGSAWKCDSDMLDGKHASDFIIPADFETNQLYTPTLSPNWTILNSEDEEQTGVVDNTSSITLEYGYKPSAIVQAKWTQPAGYNTPERSDGSCGIYTIPNQLAINTDTNPAANIPYATNFAPDSPTNYSKSVIVWTIYAIKRGITVSGNKLIIPTGEEISKSASLSVTYQLPIYYGVVGVNSMTEIIIKALPSSMKNCSTGSKTFSPKINALDTQYWVYAYPSAWGELTNISNADGDWTAAFTTGLINITSPNTELLTQYRYYITVNKGAFKNKTINFS